MPDWRESRRQDRLADARIARERDEARAQASLAQQRLNAELRRDAEVQRRADRAAVRAARSERWSARRAWVTAHLSDLVFAPVIVIPGVLAWSAMGAFGEQLFGPVGLGLPAVSEGAMWVFEMRNAWVSQHYPGKPVWHLRLGAWTFTAIGAALNFLHGLTRIPGSDRPHGITVGLVMALISAAGMAAHQLVKTGPKRTRAQRAAARREDRARRAAIRSAPVDLDDDGTAHVLLEPVTVQLGRKHGRTILTVIDEDEPEAEPVAAADTTDRRDLDEIERQVAEQLARALANTERMAAILHPYRGTAAQQSTARGDTAPAVPNEPQPDPEPSSEPEADPAPDNEPAPDTTTVPNPRRPASRRRTRKLTVAEARQRISDAAPGTSVADLAKLIGRSERTVRRLRGEAVPELATAGPKGG
jgi:hypothetical protein